MPLLKIEVDDAVLDGKTRPNLSPRIARRPIGQDLAPGLQHALLLLLTSFAATAINGYHPFSEDAGIYVAGIKQAVHPGMFGSSSSFIDPYVRLSVFSNWNAWIMRWTHLPIESLLFATQIATTWLLLFACWRLAARCFYHIQERWAAVLLVAVCLPVPVAGSSLFLMDPYVTSRSFSTPLALLAVTACLDGGVVWAALLLTLATLFHPLMGIYAMGFVLLLWAVKRDSLIGVVGLIATSLAAAAAVQYSQRTIVESTAYLAAVETRSYYFLYQWRWYEVAGLIAPLLLLSGFCIWRGHGPNVRSVVLARTCVLAGATSIAISLLFARLSSHSHLISTLQTVRPFLWIYFCMFLLLGGVLGRYLLKEQRWRWGVLFLGIGAGLGFVQHRIYAGSSQVELPGVASTNGWTRAFIWIRCDTARDAIVAIDANYIDVDGEDAQGLRAIAERSSTADFSKDGGAAAAFPHVAEKWLQEHTATTGLDHMSDAERRLRLAKFHVTWLVLTKDAGTAMSCPFIDDVAKVCRLQ